MVDPIGSGTAASSLRAKARGAGTSTRGGSHGIFLTGTSSLTGSGKVTIDNITVQGRTGYGVDLSQASGYAVTITNPSGILGGMGKLGTSGSLSNQIHTRSVVITTGTYPDRFLTF